MSVKLRHVGEVAILTPGGFLVGGAPTEELEESIRALAKSGNTVLIVDLSETQHINSTALGVLITAHTNYLRRGGRMMLSGVDERIKHIFTVTKLSLCFDVYDSPDQAIASLDRQMGQTTQIDLRQIDELLLRDMACRKESLRPKDAMGSRVRLSTRLMDEIQFGVGSPAVMAAGTTVPLDVWVFTESSRREVFARIALENMGATRFKSKGPVRVPRDSVLGIRVHIEGLSVQGEAGKSLSTVLWDGTMGNASFHVTVPADQCDGSLPGEVVISLHGFRLARLLFTVSIGPKTAPVTTAEFEERRCRTAFASYSSKDRARVLARVHGLQKAGVEVFLDVAGLRSGAKYESVLLDMIDSRDVFYLFWSKAARESKWVTYEWQTALRRRGIDYIDPFPLVSPEQVPPPPELGGTLHFNDWILAYLDSHPGTPWWQFWKRGAAPTN